MTPQKKVALITGASGGIGLELARIFAREGYDLALVARSEQKLNGLAGELKAKHGTNTIVIAKDLNVPTAPDEIYDALKGVTVEALVNNAGVAPTGHLPSVTWHANWR